MGLRIARHFSRGAFYSDLALQMPYISAADEDVRRATFNWRTKFPAGREVLAEVLARYGTALAIFLDMERRTSPEEIRAFVRDLGRRGKVTAKDLDEAVRSLTGLEPGALGLRGDKQPEDLLTEARGLLDDPSGEARRYALKMLDRLGDSGTEALSQSLRILKEDPHCLVVAEAVRIIASRGQAKTILESYEVLRRRNFADRFGRPLSSGLLDLARTISREDPRTAARLLLEDLERMDPASQFSTLRLIEETTDLSAGAKFGQPPEERRRVIRELRDSLGPPASQPD